MSSAASKAPQSPDLADFLARQWGAFCYALFVVLPIWLRTGRRPVVFARYTGMGDILCTIPAVRQLRQRHADATFVYNCHRDFAKTPALAKVADVVTSTKYIGTFGHRYRFLVEGFYDFAHGDDRPDDGCQEPMVVEFCRQFGLALEEEHPEIDLPPEAASAAEAILAERELASDDLILIHPGPTWPVREWPTEKWGELLAELKARGFSRVGQLGVGRYLVFGKVEVPVVPGAFSLIDAFKIEECMAAIRRAKLFIGIDSGLLHIAACMRTPAVGIFGMTLPEYRFSPSFRRSFVTNRVPCAGCEHRKPRLHWTTGCPFEIRCMRTLEVSDVLAACLARLEKPAKAPV